MILEYHSQALRIKPLEDDVSPTIPAGFDEGGANTTTPCLIVEPIPLEGNGARPSHRGDGYRKAGPMYSLIVCYAVENDPTVKIDTRGVGFSLRAREFKDPQIVCYSEKRFCEWYEDKRGVTLRASSGSYGGGSEVLVCYPIDLMTATHFTERDNRRGIGVGDNGDVAFTISAGHSHGVAYVSKANHRKEE